MVIHDTNFVSVAAFPTKNDPPPLVNADAMATLKIATQDFQTVARRRLEIHKLLSGVDQVQFAQRGRHDIRGDSPRVPCRPFME